MYQRQRIWRESCAKSCAKTFRFSGSTTAVLYHQRTRSQELYTALRFALYTCSMQHCSMYLATCSRFFRPCLSRIRPALNPSRLHGCRLFSSLQKRPNFVVSRLAARHASGGNFGALLSENWLLVLGCGLLGGSLAYVSISLKRCCHCFIFQILHSDFEFSSFLPFQMFSDSQISQYALKIIVLRAHLCTYQCQADGEGRGEGGKVGDRTGIWHFPKKHARSNIYNWNSPPREMICGQIFAKI